MSEINAQAAIETEGNHGKYYVVPTATKIIAIILHAISLAAVIVPQIAMAAVNGNGRISVVTTVLSLILPSIFLAALLLLNKVPPIVMTASIGITFLYSLITNMVIWIRNEEMLPAASIVVNVLTFILGGSSGIMFNLSIVTRKKAFRILAVIFAAIVGALAIISIVEVLQKSESLPVTLSLMSTYVRKLMTAGIHAVLAIGFQCTARKKSKS